MAGDNSNSDSNKDVSSVMSIDEPTSDDMKNFFRELNSRMKCLDQMKIDVAKIGKIETALGAINTNLETALNLSKNALDQSSKNEIAISHTTAGLQHSNSRITQNGTSIKELYQLFGYVPDMHQSSNVPTRPNRDRELAVTGLSTEIIGNSMDFLKKLARVLEVDFRVN